MATMDTRSGFRLPWSSDRSQNDVDHADPAEGAPAGDTEGTPEGFTEADMPDTGAWPAADRAASPGAAPTAPPPDEESGISQEVGAPAPVPLVARKPSRLMADLTAAILATTEAARDRALATIEADATQVTEAIRAASMDGAEAIRRRAEDELAVIKDWSRTEIARIRDEAETKTETRKTTRESELTAHAAAVDRRVGEVQEAVTLYRADMDAYFGNLASEDDPARLATMAEAMPEPPPLNALADLGDLDLAAFAPAVIVEAETEGVEGEGAIAETAETAETASDDIVNWTTGEAMDSSLEVVPGGEPVDRDAIMAALEAAAEAALEAVVAAEAGAEPLIGRVDTDEPTEEALTARVDADGFDSQSFTDRLASLMPSPDDGAGDGERTTRVIVTGLVSVASIASMKRHLSRLADVISVGVASGSGGEFVFTVSHRPDAPLRDGIPSMPGFAARITSTGDGFVQVTARDPESEG